ncbi:MAG: right-handed parallel beta-helix repeat-containing protein [Clostridia bacterium]|nr:right-handed parallel beta-helix repeat-containing protein [Clostridia bacterium]
MTIYVSKTGSDRNDGTKDAPFLTLERAQRAAREEPGSSVVVSAGEYRECLVFGEEDSGTSWTGEEGAVLTGGVRLTAEQAIPVPEEFAGRLTPDAAAKVRAYDLCALGLTKEDWGPLCPIGAYNTAERYDDAPTGTNLEVFSGDRRMTLARYPNEGYLRLEAVMDVGEVNEFPAQNYWRCNNTLRNPRGGCYLLDRGTNERVKGWRDPSTAWVFGYFMWDWADSSSPVTFYTENRAMYPRFVSNFGVRPGALYYLYNVPEELDSPGEYYLDRERGLLLAWPYEENDEVTLSLERRPLVSGKADGLTFEGFTLAFVRADGISLSGNGVTLRRLLVKNTADSGIVLNGRENLVSECEITRTGHGGVRISGDNRNTLKPGNSRVERCYIHDYSEVYQTYQVGVSLGGVGNVCAHNEICRSPHIAVSYGGNDHLIEYNYIHDEVLHSSDAGAIYAGFDWCGHGTVIRYNLLSNIGSDEFDPDGIYWDDGQSGQTAYGNILVDVRKNGFLAGGGFENVIRDNLILGNCKSPISYDQRNRDGFLYDGWARQAVNTPDAPHWQKLRAVPYLSEPWRKKFPSLGRLKTDFSTDPDDPDFPINPTGSVVENNIVINEAGSLGWIADSVPVYGRVENNRVFRTAEEAGFDPETLTFRVRPEGFPEIPVEKIGRQG